mmetsp:Transcript_24961/g.62569  ORF Transcript_24961/g.62569 Transcript_24961/m.62569 type:complete len:214 (-) Transcript_24961:49-690(-)
MNPLLLQSSHKTSYYTRLHTKARLRVRVDKESSEMGKVGSYLLWAGQVPEDLIANHLSPREPSSDLSPPPSPRPPSAAAAARWLRRDLRSVLRPGARSSLVLNGFDHGSFPADGSPRLPLRSCSGVSASESSEPPGPSITAVANAMGSTFCCACFAFSLASTSASTGSLERASSTAPLSSAVSLDSASNKDMACSSTCFCSRGGSALASFFCS